jgi:hypothetical protein
MLDEDVMDTFDAGSRVFISRGYLTYSLCNLHGLGYLNMNFMPISYMLQWLTNVRLPRDFRTESIR